MKWRPKEWKNPFQQIADTHVTQVGCKDDPAIFEAGADAMLKAIIDWFNKQGYSQAVMDLENWK